MPYQKVEKPKQKGWSAGKIAGTVIGAGLGAGLLGLGAASYFGKKGLTPKHEADALALFQRGTKAFQGDSHMRDVMDKLNKRDMNDLSYLQMEEM